MLSVEYGKGKTLCGLTQEQLDKVKKDLTFVNPAYEQVKRFSKWDSTKVPPYLYFYKINGTNITVPQGYTLNVPFEVTKDDRNSFCVEYPRLKITLREIQEKAVSHFQDIGTLVLPTGTGKAQTLDTKILTPKGYKLMGDIEIGDKVIGEDGNFYSVSGIYPQGVKDVYELTFKDGTKTKCCKEHLWKYATANMLHHKRGVYKVAELQEIVKNGLKSQGSYKFNIPINKPINYSDVEVLIPPYVLGLLLGDGCLSVINGRQCKVYFSNTEKDLVTNLNDMMGDLGEFVYNKSTQCQYLFRNSSEGIKYSRFVQEIKRLNLNVLGEDKFIPNEYKFNSVEKRLELLKGLFDTNGSVGLNGSYRFSSSSKSLIKDVEFLCRSLGYRTTLKIINRVGRLTKVKGKQYLTKNPEYTLTILTDDIIFKSKKHLERKEKSDKLVRPAQKHKYDVLPVVDIRYVGKEECQCIMVDSKEHTYLCDDFIVTHNTIVGIYLSYKLKQRTLVVVNKDDLVDGWMNDIKLCFGDGIDVGLVKGKAFKIGKHFTVTTIQTLSRLGDKKLEQLFKNISMLIVDECHRAGAKSYQVLNSFPVRYRLGLTATKMRNDGLVDAVDLLCGHTVFDGSTEKTDAIIPPENIHVLKLNSNIYWSPQRRYYNTSTKMDIHSFKLGGQEFIEGTEKWKMAIKRLEALGKVAVYPLRLHKAYDLIATDVDFNAQVLRDIKNEYLKGHSCIVFCKTVDHLNFLYDYLKCACPKIQKFFGGMKETKAEIKQRAESKEVLVTLATLAIATEGTNVKSWEVAFLVGDIGNEKDLIQAIGRIRRTKEGKKECWIYDYRHPKMVSIRNHGKLRDGAYSKLGIKC